MKTKKAKSVKKAKKPTKQTQVRSKAARANIAEGTRLRPCRTSNQGPIHQGLQAEGTEHDLGAHPSTPATPRISSNY